MFVYASYCYLFDVVYDTCICHLDVLYACADGLHVHVYILMMFCLLSAMHVHCACIHAGFSLGRAKARNLPPLQIGSSNVGRLYMYMEYSIHIVMLPDYIPH